MQEDNSSAPILQDIPFGNPISPVIRASSEHRISRREIDRDAIRVLYVLSRNDYTAYLVGGGVRDLLLGRKPKDFDISTNARPEEIKSLFKKCFLIGRRFRLAHIRFGEKIIETSTFRRAPENDADPNDPEADLFQRDDNLFGTPEEDALRRDFTVNGLFYDIESLSIIDYVGGMEDLKERRIRSIGDPCIRFREDPVRMIRAVRFASRLDFSIDPDDLDAIAKHRDELAKAAPARMLEEICRLFAFSSGEKAVGLLESTGLLEVILPEIAHYLARTPDPAPFWRRLAALDHGDTVLSDASQALIFAVLFTDPLNFAITEAARPGDTRQRFETQRAFLNDAAQRLQLPRKMKDRMIRIIVAQPRFANPGKKRIAEAMVRQEWFQEALALAEINAVAEDRPLTALNPWREMLADLFCGKGEAGRRKPQQAQAKPEAVPAAQPQAGESAGEKATSLPGQGLSRSARRRRNRQKNRERRTQETVNGQSGTDTPLAVPAAAAPHEHDAGQASPAEPKQEDAAPERPAAEPDRKAKAIAPAPAAGETGAAQPKKRASRTTAKAKEAKTAKTRIPAVAEPAAAAESNDGAKPKPLTAASFYTKAVAAKPARSRGAKAKEKKTAAGAAKAEASAEVSVFDRAVEADTPMHWLDEI